MLPYSPIYLYWFLNIGAFHYLDRERKWGGDRAFALPVFFFFSAICSNVPTFFFLIFLYKSNTVLFCFLVYLRSNEYVCVKYSTQILNHNLLIVSSFKYGRLFSILTESESEASAPSFLPFPFCSRSFYSVSGMYTRLFDLCSFIFITTILSAQYYFSFTFSRAREHCRPLFVFSVSRIKLSIKQVLYNCSPNL